MGRVLDQLVTDSYAIYNGDAMEVLPDLPDGSVHLSVYSPPFAGLYHYSSSERDLSNAGSYGEFFEMYGFFVWELARLTMPGRCTAVHCMDVPAGNSGGDTLTDFPGDVIRLHQQHGFGYVGRHVIWKEPLAVRNRTMIKDLTHKTTVDDCTLAGLAGADYLLIFRRDGVNPVPVTHPHGFTEYYGAARPPADVIRYRDWTGNQIENRYSQWVWRQYASAVWDDIRGNLGQFDRRDVMAVLPYRQARDEEDEKHVHPLQLDVVRRAVVMRTNPGETVLTPFMGVGTEVVAAAELGRPGIGIELKSSYYRQAVKNLAALEAGHAQQPELDLLEEAPADLEASLPLRPPLPNPLSGRSFTGSRAGRLPSPSQERFHMSIRSKVLATAGALALLGGIGTAGVLGTATAASAAPSPSSLSRLFTATTSITNDGAIAASHGAPGDSLTDASDTWAVNGPGATGFTRTLTVYADSDAADCAGVAGFSATADECYYGTFADTGPFQTNPNAYQPNQESLTAADQTGDVISNVVSGTFTGSGAFTFYAPIGVDPSASNVQGSVNIGADDPQTGHAGTAGWFGQAFTTGAGDEGILDDTWSWTYKTACGETWTDSYANGQGQSVPVSADGEITGTVTGCTTTVSPSASSYGNEVNEFGNGLDVYRQRDSVNTPIAGWAATQDDPATHFLFEAEGSDFRIEYAPDGTGTGLCVSNPGDDELVLRGCNANAWQRFYKSGSLLVSAVNGTIVDPHGKGGQLSTGAAAVSWGGSDYAFEAVSSLPV
ncbi:MAG: DNA-methyltransferase [Streptosporangiaceae bacterium]